MSEPNINVDSLPQGPSENLMVHDETIQLPGLSISDRTCNILITIIVLIISFLVYRRLFLL